MCLYNRMVITKVPNNNIFEQALTTAITLPLIEINRDDYLRKSLKSYCTDEQIEIAIENNPAYAGIDINIIEKIAESSINYETNKVSLISAASGIPGGFAMLGTIPADLAQVLGHQLIILQKLIYLYGWDDLVGDDGFDDETINFITLFMGVMFGVNQAGSTISKISLSAAQKASKKLAEKALTKTIYYPIVKKIASNIGVKMTKDIFAKSVSKAIPVVGAATSGGLTYFTFKPMARRLKKHLSTLKFCDVNYYNSLNSTVIEL